MENFFIYVEHTRSKSYNLYASQTKYCFYTYEKAREFVLLHCDVYETNAGFELFTLFGCHGNQGQQKIENWFILNKKQVEEIENCREVFVNNNYSLKLWQTSY